MNALLDTNFISNNLNNDCSKILQVYEQIYIPILVKYELKNLVNEKLEISNKRLDKLKKISLFFENISNAIIINIDENTIKQSNNLFYKLQAKRLSKSINNEKSLDCFDKDYKHIDNLIAGIALEHKMIVLTKDKHFTEFKEVCDDLLIQDN